MSLEYEPAFEPLHMEYCRGGCRQGTSCSLSLSRSPSLLPSLSLSLSLWSSLQYCAGARGALGAAAVNGFRALSLPLPRCLSRSLSLALALSLALSLSRAHMRSLSSALSPNPYLSRSCSLQRSAGSRGAVGAQLFIFGRHPHTPDFSVMAIWRAGFLVGLNTSPGIFRPHPRQARGVLLGRLPAGETSGACAWRQVSLSLSISLSLFVSLSLSI